MLPGDGRQKWRPFPFLLDTLRIGIADVEDWAAHDSNMILRSLSAIESYKTTSEGCSFEGVSINGAHRFQVKDGNIQDLSR